MWDKFLAELNTRPKEILSSFKKGDYFKLGSKAYQVVRKNKKNIRAVIVEPNGTKEYRDTFWEQNIEVIRLTQEDIDHAIELRITENIKLYSPFDGLGAAINNYLVAEKEQSNHG